MNASTSAHKAYRTALLGAVLLMATSATGPGFLIQTTTSMARLGAVLAFAILISVLPDIAIQLNAWRVVAVFGHRVQELGNAVLPGLGWLTSILVTIGSVAFSIGNVGGAGLGVNVMLGVDVEIGGIVIAILIIGLFLSRQAGTTLNKVLVMLGVMMILITGVVAFSSNSLVGEVLKNTVMPDTTDLLAITTLVSGTIGGYITYAGAHRMLNTGVGGVENLAQTTRSSVTSIIVTATMCFLLFLAVLGMVAGGVILNMDGNPTAEAFQAVAGDWGIRFPGIVLWAAGIPSIVGASYISVTFLTRSSDAGAKTQNTITIILTAISTLLFGVVSTAPVTPLVLAGVFNGLALPIGVTVPIYIVLFRTDLMNGYKYPKWLAAIGIVGVAVAWFLAWRSFGGVFEMLG